MRFINDDATLLHDKRIIPYYNSAYGLVLKIKSEAEKNGCTCIDGFEHNDTDAKKAIRAVMKNDRIAQDNVFGVDIENFICNYCPTLNVDIGSRPSLLGEHTLDNGLTFYGFIAGGDGQHGVFMILYHDGEGLRLYTPVWGNKLNINRQEPLMYDKRSDNYISKYGLKRNTLGFNWHAMKFDILANFTVDYSNVVEKHLKTIGLQKGE